MMVAKYAELLSERDWTRLKEDLNLPPRQAQILRCVLDGMSDKQIAKTVGISFGTVRTHLSRLFERCGSKDRVELILYMFGHLRQYHPQDDDAHASVVPTPTTT